MPRPSPLEKRLIAFFALVAVACLVLGRAAVIFWPAAVKFGRETGLAGPGGGAIIDLRLDVVGAVLGLAGIVAVVGGRRALASVGVVLAVGYAAAFAVALLAFHVLGLDREWVNGVPWPACLALAGIACLFWKRWLALVLFTLAQATWILRDSDLPCFSLALLGLAALVGSAALSPKHERAAPVVAAISVVLATGLAGATLAPLVGVAFWQVRMMRGPMKLPPPELEPVPGRAAEIAEKVVAEIRRGLKERRGSFTTPLGTERAFFVFRGTGVNDPAVWPLEYESARWYAGCVLLPRDDEEDKDDVVTILPRLAFDASPLGIDRGMDKLIRSIELTDNDDTRALLGRGFPIGGGFSYAFALRRRRPGLHETPSVVRSVPLAEELYEVRVFVLRDWLGTPRIQHEVAFLVGP